MTTTKLTKETVLSFMTPTMPGLDKNGNAVEVPTSKALKALIRGLLVVHANQTADEQSSKSTNHSNGEGFTGTDANILTDFAETVKGIGFYTNFRTNQRVARTAPKELTVGQQLVLRKLMLKYAGQIAKTVNASNREAEERMEDARAEYESEHAAENAVERYYEDRGSYDPTEEALWQIDPQTNGSRSGGSAAPKVSPAPAPVKTPTIGEALLTTISTMLSAHSPERDILTVVAAGSKAVIEESVKEHEAGKSDLGQTADMIEDYALTLSGDLRALKALLKWIVEALRGRMAEMLLDAGTTWIEMAAEAEAVKETAPVPAPEPVVEETKVPKSLRVYSSPKLPTLDNLLSGPQVTEPKVEQTEEAEDEFDSLFPKHLATERPETKLVDAIDDWMAGKHTPRRGRSKAPVSESGPWALATVKVC